jgi:Na+-translocating ferredoxin:NAD+ oxidoreductase RnfD subunit
MMQTTLDRPAASRTSTPTARPARAPARAPAAVRFVKTPKGLLLIALGLLALVAMLGVGLGRALPDVLSGMLVAALVDVALMIVVRGAWAFPGGALLTGLIVALVLSPSETFYVVGLTAALAVASKYVFRTRWSNVFNPAALALVASYFLFGAAQSWWGALPTLPAVAVLLVLGVGVFIADRVNKVPLALTYLGAFFGLFALTAVLGNPAGVAEVFRSPDANAALFLALFMLDDPPTSPTRYRDQVVFAALAALASYAIYLTIGAVYYLPAGILVANAWESWRRLAERRRGPARAAATIRPSASNQPSPVGTSR